MSQSNPTSLYDCLAAVPDFRRAQGQRFPLSALLVMITMGILSGHYGYREIARFLKVNQKEIVQHLALSRDRVPSHVTIRTVLMHLDFDKLNECFCQWASEHLQLAPGAWVALDAKAIRSTVTDYGSCYQDFVSMVSAFAQQQGVVIAVARYHNRQRSEIEVAGELVATLAQSLGLTGVVVTMDALHCKKRPSLQS